MKTKNGHDVIIHDMNGPGTYCIKGTVIMPGRQRNRYHIWDKRGRTYFFRESGFDLDIATALTQENTKC